MTFDVEHIDDRLIMNFLTGELSEEDAALFRSKLETDSDFLTMARKTAKLWEASYFASTNHTHQADPVKALDIFLQKNVRPQVTRKAKARKVIYWTMGVAASFLFVLMVFGLNYANRKIEVATLGEKLTGYVLPDHSVIDLKEKSKISYAANFVKKRREVTLSGEAFFEVKSDAAKPFIVYVNNVVVRVVGTSFNVKATQNQVEVIVKTGKVFVCMVGHPEKYIFLEPNQKGIVYSDKDSLVKFSALDEVSEEGLPGTFNFEKTPLAEVLKTIGDYYGVTITCRNAELNNVPVSASFNNQTLAQILDILSYSNEMKFSTKGRIIIAEKSSSYTDE
jgi:ferric-dicitrate binding protein FerR (iron transport regulator)